MTNHTILVFAHLAVGQAARIFPEVLKQSVKFGNDSCCAVMCGAICVHRFSILHFVSQQHFSIIIKSKYKFSEMMIGFG